MFRNHETVVQRSFRWRAWGTIALVLVALAPLGCGESADSTHKPVPKTADSESSALESVTASPTEPKTSRITENTAQEKASVESANKSKSTTAAPKPMPITTKPQPLATIDDAPRKPATVEEAARVLDLSAFPILPGADVSGRACVAMLAYRVKSDAKSALEFQQKQLAQKGWNELPGGNAAEGSFYYTRDGFLVHVLVMDLIGEPDKVGWVSVTIRNHGNIDVAKLPVPTGATSLYAFPGTAAFVSPASVAEAIDACNKLFQGKGWTPYGSAGASDDHRSIYLKHNAIRLHVSATKAPAQGGKTAISYATEQLSADLPVPPEVADPRYVDFMKTLHFDLPSPPATNEKLADFYQANLGKTGWKGTTEKPVTTGKDAFMIFRNPQGDRIDLDMKAFTNVIRVNVRQLTAAEDAELERKIKEKAERRKTPKS